MVPLYAARIEDLGPGDFVRLECIACGHDALIPPSSLLNGTTAARCRGYDAKGKAVVSIKWAGD